MSFEVFVLHADEATLLPRQSDVLQVFEGRIVGPPGDPLVVGSANGGQCEIGMTWSEVGDPLQTGGLTIYEPIAAPWLWHGVLDLLLRFDLFVMVPGAPDAYGAFAREDVTIPAEIRDSHDMKRVGSAEELLAAVVRTGRRVTFQNAD